MVALDLVEVPGCVLGSFRLCRRRQPRNLLADLFDGVTVTGDVLHTTVRESFPSLGLVVMLLD